ncbi:MAG: putative component of type VI protein secretion system, partial [Vicingaceae bacterium]
MNWNKIILSAFILFVCFSACKKNTQPQKKEGITATYEADWKTIDKMEQKGLGNSIVTKVDTILLKALAEENTAQVFKALAYRSKYY